MSALSFPKKSFAGVLPVTSAPRLVAAFLDRHGAGLQDVCVRVHNGAEERLDAVRRSVALLPADPTALAEALEALAECLDAAHGHDEVAAPAGLPNRPDLDAAIRWDIARLLDLAVFRRAV
jgi:hypothetical protein